ncbi:FAD-dependent oxidoreductase [Amycolatopsis benzoatilytica]|uniref:FAD-dependent oxidoreductase n=1 Tax=Amycolatopsis benzoatilytica TaxID=346045 RepID=UPI00036F8640|nr:FAD-dependent oxidoreductase [Amycolatopsis benzoatilytica]
MNESQVVVIGAGPYGLSLAAHLRAAGVRYRQFGLPMQLWRESMPNGMFLKSQGFASNLSDPDGRLTLAEFCRRTERPYAHYGQPVPVETFTEYGLWFARELALPVEQTLVGDVRPGESGFTVTLADGECLRAGAVVVAAGVQHFAHVPAELAALPSEVCTHSSSHSDLSAFRGSRVAVLGAGQSALECAALLHENGAEATLVSRRPALSWNGYPLPSGRSPWRRLREPEAALGSGWGTWFYSGHPDWFRRLPRRTRVSRAASALGPAGASWLRPRVEGAFPVMLGRTVTQARVVGDEVRLGLRDRAGADTELVADHLIAATGYRPAPWRLEFLAPPVRSRLRAVAGGVEVGRDYQSSVPGLYFIGPAVATSFGPVMRFVHGAAHASRAVSTALVAAAAMSPDAGRVIGAEP